MLEPTEPNNSNSILAISPMVSLFTADETGGSDQDTDEGSSAGNTTDKAPTEDQIMVFDRLAHLREALRKKNASPDTEELLLRGKGRLAKHRNYSSAQKKWVAWCAANNIPPFQAPASAIAAFLVEQHKQGKAAKSCQLYRLVIGKIQTGGNPYQDPLVVEVHREIAREVPPINLAERPVDISPIIEHFKKTTNSALNLRALTYKLIWLFAIVTFSRVSDLDCMGCRSIVIDDTVLRGVINCPKETRNNQRVVKEFHLHRHPDPCLCPVECFIEYRRRWQAKGKLVEGTKIFLIPNTGLPAKPSTLSRWIKSIFGIAGSNLRAHGARKMGATLALRGFDVNPVVILGNWASSSTFDLLYRRDRAFNADITSVIL
ncbi:uncharacterized protein VTP21DRAFT_5318 [Calcarisporiella thermophila]|uniref:uncharacterized protein n=1 Tax=Calcarisporiella thermophila TaxID=911321 RepID=UPI0037436CFA